MSNKDLEKSCDIKGDIFLTNDNQNTDTQSYLFFPYEAYTVNLFFSANNLAHNNRQKYAYFCLVGHMVLKSVLITYFDSTLPVKIWIIKHFSLFMLADFLAVLFIFLFVLMRKLSFAKRLVLFGLFSFSESYASGYSSLLKQETWFKYFVYGLLGFTILITLIASFNNYKLLYLPFVSLPAISCIIFEMYTAMSNNFKVLYFNAMLQLSCSIVLCVILFSSL